MTDIPTETPQRGRGRPRINPPKDAAARIEAAAADGFSVVGVAAQLGVSEETLRRWQDDDADLQAAFNRGREKERHTLHNMLYRQATEKGNATAAMFLLKARHGYREGDQAESGNRVSITFQLPGAMPLADFKVVEYGNADHRAERLPAPHARLTRGN